jgi:NRPS condensation-like uncharacterized protein
MTALGETARAPATPSRRPLSTIEELDLYLDSAQEPNLVQLETHARGHLDRAALAAALAAVLAATPEAARRLAAVSPWDRRLHWHLAAPGDRGGSLIVADWHSPGELADLRERLFATPLSLYDATFRLILAVGPDHDVVLLQVHHAAFDGISSVALLTAISGAYTERARGGAELSGPVPADVPAAGGAGESSGPGETGGLALPAWLRREQARADGGSRTPGRRVTLPGTVTRIAPQGGSPGRPGYGFVLTSMPVPRLARTGRGPHPTVNDLLVAALSLTVDRWNTAHGHRSGRIRITVPVNARDPEQRWQGYGNLSRLIRVSTQTRQRTDPGVLLAQVAAQTRAGKQQHRAEIDAMSRLLAAGWAPAVIKQRAARLARRLGSPVLTDTSLVTNLGVLPDPPSFGGSSEQPLWIAAPAPMPRGLSVGAVTVSGRLCLSIRYRHALLDQAAATAFTGAYGEAVTELAGPQQRGPCQ